jgi:perosamine synthetase
MKKNIISVNELKFFGNEKKFLNRCINEKFISSNGSIINEFEKKFSNLVNRKYGTTVVNGSAALELAIQVLNLNPKDEVILPAFTIISCCNAIIKNNLKPVLIDCDPHTWNMDHSQIEKKITKKTKAIIIVHIYGLTCNINKILKIAQKYNLKVIEDAAEAVGQYYLDKPCGSFGDISTFSFYANKHLTTGEGGMILTNKKIYYDRMLRFKNLCFGDGLNRFLHTGIGSNYRMTSFQAAFGLSQLENLKKILKIKISLGKKYNNLLQSLNKCLQLPLLNTKYCDNQYWVYGLVLKKNLKIDNKYIIKKLEKKGIGCRPFFTSMNLQPVYKKLGYFKNNRMKNAEYLSKKGFYIPSGVGTTDFQIKRVSNEIISILRKFNV